LAENQIVCKEPLEDCHVIRVSLIKRILVPFDSSQYAFRAFAHALDLAKKYGASLVVVAVSNESDKVAWVNETPSRQKGIGKSRNAEFKEVFKKLENEAAKFKIQFEALILESNLIAEAIISFATKKHVDYIVMGTHGKGQAKEMMLGRVSTSIALNAHCPVVLVK
jgi:nucleotide-binding universal stress UspA family protein